MTAVRGSEELAWTWTRVGAVTGIVASVLYPVLLIVPLPTQITAVLAGGWGMLITVTAFGMYHSIAASRRTVSAQIGAMFLALGGFTLTLMLIIQQVLAGYLEQYGARATGDEVAIVDWLWRGTTPIHLALDICWDFFLTAGMVLLGANMIRHPRFGPWIGWCGIALGLLVFGINLYAFPFTPEDVGIPYFYGPIAGLWFIATCVLMLRMGHWFRAASEPVATVG